MEPVLPNMTQLNKIKDSFDFDSYVINSITDYDKFIASQESPDPMYIHQVPKFVALVLQESCRELATSQEEYTLLRDLVIDADQVFTSYPNETQGYIEFDMVVYLKDNEEVLKKLYTLEENHSLQELIVLIYALMNGIMLDSDLDSEAARKNVITQITESVSELNMDGHYPRPEHEESQPQVTDLDDLLALLNQLAGDDKTQ